MFKKASGVWEIGSLAVLIPLAIVCLLKGIYLLAVIAILLAIQELKALVYIDLIRYLNKRVEKLHQQEMLFRAVIKPGDLIDLLAVTAIKAEKLSSESASGTELARSMNLAQLFYLLYDEDPNEGPVERLHIELRKINKEQWTWEDRLRTDKSVEAALGARECNNRRVAKKNEINELFGYTPEYKQYQGTKDGKEA